MSSSRYSDDSRKRKQSEASDSNRPSKQHRADDADHEFERYSRALSSSATNGRTYSDGRRGSRDRSSHRSSRSASRDGQSRRSSPVRSTSSRDVRKDERRRSRSRSRDSRHSDRRDSHRSGRRDDRRDDRRDERREENGRKQETPVKTPEEEAREKERQAELEYQKRVQAQLEVLEQQEEKTEEQLAEERRQKRAALMAKIAAEKPKEDAKRAAEEKKRQEAEEAKRKATADAERKIEEERERYKEKIEQERKVREAEDLKEAEEKAVRDAEEQKRVEEAKKTKPKTEDEDIFMNYPAAPAPAPAPASVLAFSSALSSSSAAATTSATSSSTTSAVLSSIMSSISTSKGFLAQLAQLRDDREKENGLGEAVCAHNEAKHHPLDTTADGTGETKKPAAIVPDSGFDMFSDDITVSAGGAKDAAPGVKEDGGKENLSLMDNWLDPEGYYRFRLGDLLDNGRYRVVYNSGKGVFSTVMKVQDTALNGKELVVKVIRNNETMRKAGLRELEFLKELAAADPENKKHVVRLLSSFEHRGHLCLVFEPMHMNLRQLLKKFNNQGLEMEAVRSFSKQMLSGLKLLLKCKILHADIKPDNILVAENLKKIKICDLGSAARLSPEECEITPYLISRFYRAPEIMLGLPYNEAADMWSIGCVIYELFTGQILFTGANNNDMLYQIQLLKGGFPKRLLRKATFAPQHYDADFTHFELRQWDQHLGKELRKPIKFDKPTKDLRSLLRAATAGPLAGKELRRLNQLSDFLSAAFELDPSRRLTVEKAMLHPFIKED